jgi:hypothetical protein
MVRLITCEIKSLSLNKEATASLHYNSGNVIVDTATILNSEMLLRIKGSALLEYKLIVKPLSNENLVKWAFDATILHEESLIADLYKNLTASQFISGIKISERSSVRLLDSNDKELGLEKAIVSKTKVEITAQNGALRTYTIYLGNDLKPDTLISNSKKTFYELPLDHYQLGANIEWHLLSNKNPIPGSQINFTSEDIWIYFPNILPQTFNDKYLGQIFVNGAKAQNDVNIRLVQHGNGSVLIGHSNTYQPLTIYTDANLSGESKNLSLYTYYKQADGQTQEPSVSLGTFDNNIESFILKKGYMASFSENTNGTGYSKVFIADHEDIVVNTMPTGLSNSVSFIRIFPWRWVNRKGFVGNANEGQSAGSQWVYCHCDSFGEQSSLNVEYVPLRHNPGWPSYTSIQAKKNVTHALYYNEPDNSVDDGFSTVANAIAQYSNLLASGLRMVSPAPTDGGAAWLIDFVNQCKIKNYRLDAVAIHFYRGCQTSQQFYDFLNYIHNNTGLPIWVTEWNNGCNWSGDGCIPTSYDEQAQVIQEWVDMLESAPFVERYSIWPGCTTYQQFYSPSGITPSGALYRDKQSRLAYTSVSSHDFNFYPENESDNISSTALSWIPREGTHGQLVYFGNVYPPVFKSQVAGNVGHLDVGKLQFNQTYFWRIDEYQTDGTIVKGQELQFTYYSQQKATNPAPADGAAVGKNLTSLSWVSDPTHVQTHRIYFGLNSENLFEEGSLSIEITQYPLTNLVDSFSLAQTYYWRIDEVLELTDGSEVVGKGDLWSFTISDLLMNEQLIELSIYPNPAHDILHISGIKSKVKVEVYDIIGKKVLDCETEGSISLTGLHQGVHFLHIDGKKVIKFMID